MAFHQPGRMNHQTIKGSRLPVTITCLQWDCDGALNDEDREWMLQKLSSQESIGSRLTPWLYRHGL